MPTKGKPVPGYSWNRAFIDVAIFSASLVVAMVALGCFVDRLLHGQF